MQYNKGVNMFDSEFCNVQYNIEDRVVLLTWKKFSSGQNYRDPVKYSLEIFKSNQVSNYVVDARNGFEDEKGDVDWVFTEFLPKMGNTACKKVVFIMEVVNNIQGEMDMWTKKFSEYFKVIKATTYEEALEKLQKES